MEVDDLLLDVVSLQQDYQRLRDRLDMLEAIAYTSQSRSSEYKPKECVYKW